MKPLGPVSLYCLPRQTPHLVSILQPGHPTHPSRGETPDINRVPQNVPFRTEFDSLGADGCHGLYVSSLFSFGSKIIPKTIFNNQGNDEYGMRNGRLYGSGYLMLEIRLCPMR